MSRQQRTGQPFWDPAVPQDHFAAALPDPLRIKPMGVQAIQAAVYEDFGKSEYIRHFAFVNRTLHIESKHGAGVVSRPGSAVAYSRNEQMVMYNQSPALEHGIPGQPIPHQEAMDRFTVCFSRDVSMSFDAHGHLRQSRKILKRSSVSCPSNLWLLCLLAMIFATSSAKSFS